ncbi:MAG: BatA domain-containing protein [Gemmatimonadales bacterium]
MIGFAFPWALVGLMAAAVPLLLHLVRRHDAPEVVFPAVRYLEDATRQQQRRLKLRNWLLLALRIVLILALVFAAAGMTVRQRSIGPHPASAMAVIVDNGVASGAVVDGEPLLDQLKRAADQVLRRATPTDRLWLIAADGVARGGTAAALRERLVRLGSAPALLDLGAAIGAGRDLIRSSKRSGQVVVITPLQRAAVGAAGGAGDILVLRPTARMPANRAVTILTASAQPWSPDGGRLIVAISSSDTVPTPVTLSIGGRTLRDVLVAPGVPSVQRIGPQPPGWITATAALPPDELRLDDTRSVAVRVAPPAEVSWDSTDRFVDAAAGVLESSGRIRRGPAIRLGDLGPATSIVVPPDDPARIGALNRALAAAGVTWRFGSLVVAGERFDSGPLIPARETVSRRYTLDHTGGGGEVLATVGGSPWLVSAGRVILVGSRFDPAWTGLPLSASFVPFLDAVLTSIARGELRNADAIVGTPVRLPERATAVAQNGLPMPVEGGSMWTPRAVGIDYVLAGVDTIGTISAGIDPRASDLARASDAVVRALWPGATVADLAAGPRLAFAFVAQSDARGPLLVLAVLCAVAETFVAGRGRRRT